MAIFWSSSLNYHLNFFLFQQQQQPWWNQEWMNKIKKNSIEICTIILIDSIEKRERGVLRHLKCKHVISRWWSITCTPVSACDRHDLPVSRVIPIFFAEKKQQQINCIRKFRIFFPMDKIQFFQLKKKKLLNLKMKMSSVQWTKQSRPFVSCSR